ncbi:DUF6682 family protein [Aquabacterium sp.]|uniref:phage adaptor protein n=1 Tax=Aquabacterium sp. TaxID=1872578 RepID=UPI002619A19C|nr:DUF6682 family protein [Aquabacterium sp.]MDD2978130.1 hypothetical protein [Aquabacterium sp.]
MTLAQLIARYRTDAADREAPYFVDDPELAAFFNEAETQACIRGRLIHESSDPALCEIDIAAGDSVYQLHPCMYELDHVAFRADGQSRRSPVRQVSQEWLDGNVPDWRDAEGDPTFVIQGDMTLRLVPRPERSGALLIEGYRLPKREMDDPDDSPGINNAHHPHLIHWVLYRVFSIPDAEFFDAQRAATALERFANYFGEQPDSDMRRITREDIEHAVRGFMP